MSPEARRSKPKGVASVQKTRKAVVRRRPNWTFVAITAVVALGAAVIVLVFDVREDRAWFISAAFLGIFVSVWVVGVARWDTNRRRREGYIDTSAFFVLLNGSAVAGWLIGMYAVFLLSYEVSRGVG